MKFIRTLLIMFLLSCSPNDFEKASEIIYKINKIGIEYFDRIEFGLRGPIELYTYHFNDSLYYVWTYSTETQTFSLNNHPEYEMFKNVIGSPEYFVNELRNNIRDLKVVGITQAPWTGNLIRFWISNTKFVSYVNPNFLFDTESKKRWQAELKRGIKLQNEWFLVSIDSTRS